MSKLSAVFAVITLLMAGCGRPPSEADSHATSMTSPSHALSQNFPEKNLLGQEKSPYLLQHADNPVHWYPWGEPAFAKAAAQDRPVFLSIGYSTCHWCHVMEHESFEDPAVAEILNTRFVAVKVDREERPDVDNVYMKAVIAAAGQGGWPLSVFLTPDGKPFYGGTYFPPEPRFGMPGFKDLLLSVGSAWQKERTKVLQSGETLTAHLKEQTHNPGGLQPGVDALNRAYSQFAGRYDGLHGGFAGAPKFPSAHNLSFLLRYSRRTGEERPVMMVTQTLDAMAAGGMYDQLGGGFHRYSTDERWHIPHFEKMLYDQAMLAAAYLEGYQAARKPGYARVAREILDYVLRDMTDPAGGFYSAEDADSLPAGASAGTEKREGAFYVWTGEEIIEALGADDANIFAYAYGVEPHGNAESDPHNEFVGQNILFAARSVEETAGQFSKSAQEISELLSAARGKLMAVRGQRPRPHLDDKILTDWNGLMISAFARGAVVLDEPRYRDAARKAAGFLLKHLVRTSDGRLLHRYRDGDAAVTGTLEDHAFLIHGLIDLYEATFDVSYLKTAKDLTEQMVTYFWDDTAGGFFFTASDAEKLLFREKEIYDGAMPSGNSIAALDLLRMGRITANSDWEAKAAKLFQTFSAELSAAPSAYAQLLCALDFALGPSKEIVISGAPDDRATQAMLKALHERFLPNKVVLLRPPSGQDAASLTALAPYTAAQKPVNNTPTAYVCQNYHCEFPVTEVEKFVELLK